MGFDSFPASPRLEKPYLVVRLLSSLKAFYTFKELEEKLGVPAQMLWRYTSLLNVPEKKTAVRILERIHEKGLLEGVYRKMILRNSYGYVETWRYLYDYHFLGLVGYEVARFVGQDGISVVLAYPPSDATLAIAVSEWLRCRVCIALREAPLSTTNFLRYSYASSDRGAITNLYVAKGAVKRGDRILLVKSLAKNWESLRAISDLVEEAGGRVWGALVVASVSDAWKSKCRNYGIERVRVLREVS